MSPEGPHLRILVGAGSYADAAAALQVVERLSDRRYAGLGGLLVEESATIAACAVPRQRIVSVSGMTAAAPSPSQIRTVIEADARAFRQSLARAAAPAGIAWSFLREAGDLIDAALGEATEWDALVFGYRRLHKARGKVIRLIGPDPSETDLQDAATQLSQGLGADLTLFSIGMKNEDHASGRHHPILSFAGLREALAVLARTNAQAVLLDLEKGPVRNRGDLARLIEAARCPVLVFGLAGAMALPKDAQRDDD